MIHGVLAKDYDSRANLGMHTWDSDSPDVAISKLMAHADRMIEAVEYLVSLSFVDCLNPGRAIMVLEVSDDFKMVSVAPPLPLPDAIKGLLVDRS
ncbi:hypothetical protein D3C79_961770 [compost metagenome]